MIQIVLFPFAYGAFFRNYLEFTPPLNLQKTPEYGHFEHIGSICNGIIPQH